MPEKTPKVILRIGTHAEKDYFEKLITFIDGIVVGANLVESTPGATASLLLKFAGAKNAKPYYIDPMSYAFGSYYDSSSGANNSNLSWIKSEQKVKGNKGTALEYKRSYRKLADAFGGLFSSALDSNKAISPSIVNDNQIQSMCASFQTYQTERIRSVFENNEDYKEFLGELPLPAAIFAPYFYIDPAFKTEWLNLNLKLTQEMAKLTSQTEKHSVICVDKNMIGDSDFETWLNDISKSGIQGVWFWISKFHEEKATIQELQKYKEYVNIFVSKDIKVFSMHGGFFSLALSKHGLEGISHGVGYGEQKDVVPIIGQSTPTVRYYLPDLYKRLGIPEIERCFEALNITSVPDFREKVCDCAICSGIVSNTIEDFQQFGEMHYSRDQSKRMSQTPAAAKRCRYHFLLNRIKECRWIANNSIADIKKRFVESAETWGKQPSLKSEADHLNIWNSVL